MMIVGFGMISALPLFAGGLVWPSQAKGFEIKQDFSPKISVALESFPDLPGLSLAAAQCRLGWGIGKFGVDIEQTDFGSIGKTWEGIFQVGIVRRGSALRYWLMAQNDPWQRASSLANGFGLDIWQSGIFCSAAWMGWNFEKPNPEWIRMNGSIEVPFAKIVHSSDPGAFLSKLALGIGADWQWVWNGEPCLLAAFQLKMGRTLSVLASGSLNAQVGSISVAVSVGNLQADLEQSFNATLGIGRKKSLGLSWPEKAGS